MQDTFTIPENLPFGDYLIEVAILDRAGSEPDTAALPPIQLGIEGRQVDGWYSMSEISVD